MLVTSSASTSMPSSSGDAFGTSAEGSVLAAMSGCASIPLTFLEYSWSGTTTVGVIAVEVIAVVEVVEVIAVVEVAEGVDWVDCVLSVFSLLVLLFPWSLG